MNDYTWKIGSLAIAITIVGLGIWTVSQKNASDDSPKKTQAEANKDKFKPYGGSGNSEKRAEQNETSAESPSGKDKSESEVVVLENTVAKEENAEDLSPPPPGESQLAKKAEKLAEERKKAGETSRRDRYKRMKEVDNAANAPFNPLKNVSFETLQRMMATNLDDHPLGGHSLQVNPNDMTEGRKEARPLPPPKDVDKLADPKKVESSPNSEDMGIKSVTVGERKN